MKTCSHCRHENPEGALYCAECGRSLKEDSTILLSTRQITDIESGLSPKQNWGTARFDGSSSIVVHVRGASDPLVLEPREVMILGRADPKAGSVPDVDFTPYDGEEKGVSRQHAALLAGDGMLSLVDKGSSNGTYLNGQRLNPDQPRIIRDGDEVRLGRLVCYIYFSR